MQRRSVYDSVLHPKNIRNAPLGNMVMRVQKDGFIKAFLNGRFLFQNVVRIVHTFDADNFREFVPSRISQTYFQAFRIFLFVSFRSCQDQDIRFLLCLFFRGRFAADDLYEAFGNAIQLQ